MNSDLGVFSGHVLFEMKSVTPQFFYISDITNSSSFNGKILRKKKSMLENFCANVLNQYLHNAVYTSTISFPHASKSRLTSNIPNLTKIIHKKSNNNFGCQNDHNCFTREWKGGKRSLNHVGP